MYQRSATPGPEDPRAVWSPEGIPLMIVGVDTVRLDACRTMAVMDIRTLWPALRDELERIDWPSAEEARKSASELQRGSEIWFDGIHEREKKCVVRQTCLCASILSADFLANYSWAGFFSPFQPAVHVGSLPLPAFHYDFNPQSLLVPSTAVKTPAGLDLLPYKLYVPSEEGAGPSTLRACMDRIQGTDSFQPVGFKVADHHATPFHPVTLRGRGTGKKRRTPSDTVLIGLAHAKLSVLQLPVLQSVVADTSSTARQLRRQEGKPLLVRPVSRDFVDRCSMARAMPDHASVPVAATSLSSMRRRPSSR